MQCTSLYPSSLKDIGINILEDYKKKFKCLVGLSDHSGSIYPSLFAISKGASLIEVHVGDKNNKNNPDNSSSISFLELKILVNARNAFNTMIKNPQNKKKINPKLKKIKKIFTKSCALNKPKKTGQILKHTDLIFKKPGTGIPEHKASLIIGKKFTKNAPKDKLLKINYFK